MISTSEYIPDALSLGCIRWKSSTFSTIAFLEPAENYGPLEAYTWLKYDWDWDKVLSFFGISALSAFYYSLQNNYSLPSNALRRSTLNDVSSGTVRLTCSSWFLSYRFKCHILMDCPEDENDSMSRLPIFMIGIIQSMMMQSSCPRRSSSHLAVYS